MKITKIETVRLTSRPTLIWVRVHTDEGLIGLCESWFGCAAVDADIHERIAPALIGADASRIEALTRAARPYVGFCGTGAEIRAASAIDVALWDIVGQAAGKPLYALLGGATRDDIRVYNTCAGPDYVSQSSDVRPENFADPSINSMLFVTVGSSSEADQFSLPRHAPSGKDQTTYSGRATGRSTGPTVAPTALASLAFASFFARIASSRFLNARHAWFGCGSCAPSIFSAITSALKSEPRACAQIGHTRPRRAQARRPGSWSGHFQICG